MLELLGGMPWRKRAANELARALTDEAPVGVERVRWVAEAREDGVDGAADVGERIDEGAIEVEENCGHGVHREQVSAGPTRVGQIGTVRFGRAEARRRRGSGARRTTRAESASPAREPQSE